MLLPVDERSRVRETDFVHASDLPALRELVGEIRREERNTDRRFIAKYQLSGQAALGMYFARMPGNLLETYRAPSTGRRSSRARCEPAADEFLGELTASAISARNQPLVDTCDELGVRPLAWDLVAATLQWDGKEKKYTVTKLDKHGRRRQGLSRVGADLGRGEPGRAVVRHRSETTSRLKLFDTSEQPLRDQVAAHGGGERAPGHVDDEAPARHRRRQQGRRDRVDETACRSRSPTTTRCRSATSSARSTSRPASSKGGAFRCSGKRTIETGLVQSFTGTLDNGVIVAFPDKDAEDVGADAGYCKLEPQADRIVAVKLEGDQLSFYPHRRQRVSGDDPADARYGAACRIQRHLNVRCTRTSHGYPIDT